MFGAEKILIHDHQSNPLLRPYIEYYSQKGVMEILPWSFPANLTGQMHCHLQQTMISDCQYRLEGISRYVQSKVLEMQILFTTTLFDESSESRFLLKAIE